MESHLIIGLGGTGGRVLAAFRKLMFERFNGDVKPKDMWVDYLYVDSSKQDLEMRDPAQWTVMGKDIKLDKDSVVCIPASNLSDYVYNRSRFKYLSPWIGDSEDWRNIINDPKIGEGAAGQKRRLGRLLFANGAPNFNSMVATKAEKLAKNPDGANITFHVVAGLAGGTGSGSIVDVVAQLRKQFPEYQANKTILYLLLPEEQKTAWATTDNYQPNGYVALTELSALDLNIFKPWDLSERDTDVQRLTPQLPFYSAYLVTNTNRENVRFDVGRVMPSTIAEVLYQKTIGVALSVKNGATESAANFFNDVEKGENPKYSNYDIPHSYKFNSFGIKRLAVPEQEIKEFFGYTFAHQALLKMLYNNLSAETGYVAEPTVKDDYAFVTKPEQKKKWYISREYLCLSMPILPEHNKEGWRPINDEFKIVDNFAREIHANGEIEHKDKLVAIGNKTKRYYDKDFRPIAEQGQNGVAVFYEKKAKFGRDSITEFIKDKINEDLLLRWRNGECSLVQLSGICQTLLNYLDEEKSNLKRLSAAADDEIKRCDAGMKEINRRWCEMGIGGKLIAAMGGNNKAVLSSEFTDALKKKYSLMTWKESYGFAELLLNDLIRIIQVTKGDIDGTISQFSKALEILDGAIKSRCVMEPENVQNQRGVVIKNYNATKVHDMAKQAIAYNTDNNERIKLSVADITALIGKEKQNFREVADKLKVGTIVSHLEKCGTEQAENFFTNEVGKDYIQNYEKLIGVNIIQKLHDEFSGNDEGLKEKLEKLVKQAAILNKQRDIEVNTQSNQPIRSSMFIILPNYDNDQQFLQKVEDMLKSLTSEGQIKVSRGGNPHEIVVVNLETNLTPRYLQSVYVLKQAYDKLMSSQQGKVARFETQLEDYNGIQAMSKEDCLKESCLPSLYNPTDEELREMEQKRNMASGQSNVAENVGMQGGMMPPPPPVQEQYFVYANNAQTGPFTLQQMQQQVTMGTVTKMTYVWKKGMPNWAAADSIPEIAALFVTNTPPPPPIMM